eukprot:gene11861-8149_t
MSEQILRLVYPQWQGGDVGGYISGVPDQNEASRGYHLGSLLVNFLVPLSPNHKTAMVPISTDISNRKVQNGIKDRDVIAEQTKAALDIIQKESPSKILVLGGDCSVSIAPFTYLNQKYNGDVGLIWLDAHPDMNLPGDPYQGMNSMVITAAMGMGDEKFTSILPSKFKPSQVLFVGVRTWSKDRHHIREKYKMQRVSVESAAKNSNSIRLWLRASGFSKVVIHLDLDVLEPTEFLAGAGSAPNGMKVAEAVRVIQDIAKENNVVALTIAEPMPRTAIRLRTMLSQLPLIN